MNETTIQGELVRSIETWGGYSRKVTDAIVCPKCGHQIVPSSGRADNYVTLGTHGCMIEVKYSATCFPFSKFRERQREWAKWYVNDLHGEYYLWLCMGRTIVHKVYPRRTWLISLREWLTIESMVSQKSLPYRAGEHYRKAMRGLDAVTLLAPWELIWEGGGVWSLPNSHPLTEAIERLRTCES